MQKILITGGNFINKGAQSMLFCLVDGLKKKYPQADLVMIDIFPSQHGDKKNKYTFKIVNMHIRTVLRMAFPILKILVKPKPISNPENEIEKHFSTADMVLDISGYGVSSHNQKAIWTYATLFPVRYAKKYDVPFVFLPQSIGPFDFTGWKKLVVWPLIKKYLKYPKTIFIREPDCRTHLDKINTQQVIDSFDLVLQSSKIEAKNIFADSSSYYSRSFNIPENSILLIPNKQLTRLKSQEEMINLFSSLVKTMVNQDQKVVILRHSADDKEMCDLIAKASKNENVYLMNEDLDPLELQELFESSKMVIAARYHGLIHALKLGKPCLVIGWANKYSHVMNTFGLNEFYFDIRKMEVDNINFASLKMLKSVEEYKMKIEDKLNEIKSSDIYKYIY
ncbi:polysaccharide pyruvyl transferase family protein [Saccharicrinis sp. 156]|uniref:polysaccharide pyruvyl transferase family protein n=1 Tax=Saccharicrinis sp. 156 TaxID=3417574 RepID=UPI003D32E16A